MSETPHSSMTVLSCEEILENNLFTEDPQWVIEKELEDYGVEHGLLMDFGPLDPVRSEEAYKAWHYLQEVLQPRLECLEISDPTTFDEVSPYVSELSSAVYYQLSQGYDANANGQLEWAEIAPDLWRFYSVYLGDKNLQNVYGESLLALSARFATDDSTLLTVTIESLAEILLAGAYKDSVSSYESGFLQKKVEAYLAVLAGRIEDIPQNKEFWKLSFRLWHAWSNFVSETLPDQMTNVRRKRSEYYKNFLYLGNPEKGGGAQYAHLFYRESRRMEEVYALLTLTGVYFRLGSVIVDETTQKTQRDQQGLLEENSLVKYLHTLFNGFYFALVLADTKVDGVSSNEFLHRELGNDIHGYYSPDFLLNDSLVHTICGGYYGEKQEANLQNSDPFFFMRNARDFFNCYGTLLFGNDSERYRKFERFFDDPKTQEHWDVILTSSPVDPVGNKKREEALGAMVGMLRDYGILDRADLKRHLGRKNLDQLQDQGVRVYRHRTNKREEMLDAVRLNYGFESDVSLTKDGHWVFWHDVGDERGAGNFTLSQMQSKGALSLQELAEGVNDDIVMGSAQHGRSVMIEVKTPDLRKAAELVKGFDWLKDAKSPAVWIFSDNRDFLREIQEHATSRTDKSSPLEFEQWDLSSLATERKASLVPISPALFIDDTREVAACLEDLSKGDYPYKAIYIYYSVFTRLSEKEQNLLKNSRLDLIFYEGDVSEADAQAMINHGAAGCVTDISLRNGDD